MGQIQTEGMSSKNELRFDQICLQVDGVDLNIDTVHRDGNLAPIVFLHGFGSTKEDYIDIAYHASFANRPFLAFDAPGCGSTLCSDLSKITIPFLAKTARAVLKHMNIQKFHLVGHSMGGLTALILAHQEPSSVLSFIDIKGNLAPEDCFLSRQIITHASENPDSFFSEFIIRTRNSPSRSSAFYSATLAQKVQPGAVIGIFKSMVELSDHGQLLQKFLSLPFPRMFMFGEEYAGLSYLPVLKENGVELAEIAHAGHFPMYSNPVDMWRRIAEFLTRNSI